MKYAFAGTPEFAGWVLAHLISLGRRPEMVISQPDRPCGRGQRTVAPCLAVDSGWLGLACLQEADINDPSVAARLHEAGVEALVVAGFGQMLGGLLLDEFLCLNVHASLLPAYRGAAPIERALMAGEERMGASIMKMTEGLDEGPWAAQSWVSVGLRDDAGSIGRVLAVLGANGIDQALTGSADGTLSFTEQQGSPSYAAKLRPSDQLLDTARAARTVHDQVRALSPSLGARTQAGEVGMKVWRTWPYGQPGLDPAPEAVAALSGEPGRLRMIDGRLFVGCASGLVEILSVQPQGKRRMSTAEFLRGYGRRLGDHLEPCLTRPDEER